LNAVLLTKKYNQKDRSDFIYFLSIFMAY